MYSSQAISFEPAGTPSPIGHYKKFCGYSQEHHFVPEHHDGTVFHDGGSRRWLHFADVTTCLRYAPNDMLCCLEKAVVGGDIDYCKINAHCPHNWGIRANYIDVLPEFFGGLHGLIRMLSLFPPSQHNTATCILVRGLFASAGHDSYAVNWFGGFDSNSKCKK